MEAKIGKVRMVEADERREKGESKKETRRKRGEEKRKEKVKEREENRGTKNSGRVGDLE